MRVLSVIPPMTQLNTPYPSTAYLTGFMRSCGIDALQEDLALALVLRLFSADGLRAMRTCIDALPAAQRSPGAAFFLDEFDRYQAAIGPAVAFLQGRDPSMGHRIAGRNFLPEGPRFAPLDDYIDPDGGDPLAWAFGALGVQDRARHFATLFLNDLADVLRESVDDRFEFVRYAESLALSQPTFEPLAEALAAPETLVDRTLRELTLEAIERRAPQVVLVSVPFPGSVYGAFRIAQAIKSAYPQIVTVLGGGYVNTELRDLAEPRVFDYFDYVTLDDGERPILALLEHLNGKRPQDRLVRTFLRREMRGISTPSPNSDAAKSPLLPFANRGKTAPVNAAVRYIDCGEPDIPFAEVGTPTWDGLPLDRYLAILDMLNPMHRLWSDARWNKLTVAHGCYWKKCSFCDVSLDYIARYEAASAEILVDRIDSIIAETGQTGFHFVDEAAPPKALKALADELHKRNRAISWWGNIRFEKSFTPGLCRATCRERLHRRVGRPGGGLGPAAEADAKRRFGRAGGAGDARLQRSRHPGACLSDVRLPDPDRAGYRRCPGIRPSAIRRRLHPVGLLPPLCLHRACAGGHAPGAVRRQPATPAGNHASPRTTCNSSTRPASTTTSSAWR
jgi:hypothetical protein